MLDAYSGESLHVWGASDTDKIKRRQQNENDIEGAIQRASRAFAAHWLPLVAKTYHLPSTQIENTVRESWRSARREMLKVINRKSYRSVLTLYLFSQTPVPVGISEDEELDGLSGIVCLQTALSQLQGLRAQRSGPRTSTAALNHYFAADRITPEYMDLENKAFWAAMTWHTFASLVLDSRTSLTSGLKGACSEPTWRLVKAFLAGSCVPRMARWHRENLDLSDQVVEEILTAATVCNTRIWKYIAPLKEALREGVHEGEVELPWRAWLEVIDIYVTSIRPLLDRCEGRLNLLNQCARLSLYQVNCQYSLGTLMFIDALETSAHSDRLQEISAVRQDAGPSAFKALKFGLDNAYTISKAVEVNGSIDQPLPLINTTLIGIDPRPRYTTACVEARVIIGICNTITVSSFPRSQSWFRTLR